MGTYDLAAASQSNLFVTLLIQMGLIKTAFKGDEIIVAAEGSSDSIALPLNPR